MRLSDEAREVRSKQRDGMQRSVEPIGCPAHGTSDRRREHGSAQGKPALWEKYFYLSGRDPSDIVVSRVVATKIVPQHPAARRNESPNSGGHSPARCVVEYRTEPGRNENHVESLGWQVEGTGITCDGHHRFGKHHPSVLQTIRQEVIRNKVRRRCTQGKQQQHVGACARPDFENACVGHRRGEVASEFRGERAQHQRHHGSHLWPHAYIAVSERVRTTPGIPLLDVCKIVLHLPSVPITTAGVC